MARTSFAEVLSGVNTLDDDAGVAEAEAEARAREQAAKTAKPPWHLELPSLLTYLVLVGLLGMPDSRASGYAGLPSGRHGARERPLRARPR